jgi:hypothetical protein
MCTYYRNDMFSRDMWNSIPHTQFVPFTKNWSVSPQKRKTRGVLTTLRCSAPHYRGDPKIDASKSYGVVTFSTFMHMIRHSKHLYTPYTACMYIICHFWPLIASFRTRQLVKEHVYTFNMHDMCTFGIAVHTWCWVSKMGFRSVGVTQLLMTRKVNIFILRTFRHQIWMQHLSNISNPLSIWVGRVIIGLRRAMKSESDV